MSFSVVTATSTARKTANGAAHQQDTLTHGSHHPHFRKWTVRAEDGVWCVLDGPADSAIVLNAIAEPPSHGVHVDEQRLCEARALYLDLRILSRGER